MLEQGPDFWCWFNTTQFSYIPLCSPNTCKYVFNPHFSQIVLRVCSKGYCSCPVCMYVCMYVCMCVVSTHTCRLTHWNHKREIPTDSVQYRDRFKFPKNASFKSYGVICNYVLWTETVSSFMEQFFRLTVVLLILYSIHIEPTEV